MAAITALQGLRDHGGIQPGQKVLVNCASGGVGTFTVQIAKAFGADVTGVCSTINLDLVRSIGADRVVDYTREDFTRTGQRYDLIIDNVGNRSASDLAHVLSPKGVCVSVGFAGVARLLQNMVLRPIISWTGGKRMVSFVAGIKNQDLVLLKELMEAGKVVPVIDRCYPMTEVPEAFRYAEQGHSRGKVVIVLD